MAGQDVLEVVVLEDGTVKITTDTISGANHFLADKFLEALREYCGGEQTRTRRGHIHEHTHSHESAKQGA